MEWFGQHWGLWWAEEELEEEGSNGVHTMSPAPQHALGQLLSRMYGGDGTPVPSANREVVG